jgi:hypothetical protein
MSNCYCIPLTNVVRDEFESKRTELEGEVSKLLGGETWKIEVYVILKVPVKAAY